MTTTITICDTCKREKAGSNETEHCDGERFAAMIELAAKGKKGVNTRRHSCLMGCSHSCNVAIQAKGKMTYVLGDFEPSIETSEAIVEYALHHNGSESGVVPFRSWPQAVKKHFRSRLPVLPAEE